MTFKSFKFNSEASQAITCCTHENLDMNVLAEVSQLKKSAWIVRMLMCSAPDHITAYQLTISIFSSDWLPESLSRNVRSELCIKPSHFWRRITAISVVMENTSLFLTCTDLPTFLVLHTFPARADRAEPNDTVVWSNELEDMQYVVIRESRGIDRFCDYPCVYCVILSCARRTQSNAKCEIHQTCQCDAYVYY